MYRFKHDIQKKIPIIMVVLCLVLVFAAGCNGGAGVNGEPEPIDQAPDAADNEPAAPAAKRIGFYVNSEDSYYSLMKDAFSALATRDPECDWVVDFVVGRNIADEQLKTVEDFIAAGYDAIIVAQNNPNTTGECIARCRDAGIPYFGAAHFFGGIANMGDAAGSVNFDYLQAGRLAGQDAVANDVSKVIMVEGLLGHSNSLAQTEGFLLAFEEAGKSFGVKDDETRWTAEEVAAIKPPASDIKGEPDITVVSWKSGEWMAEPTQAAMLASIASLGADGWDGAYVQSNPMMQGAIGAMEEKGLDTGDYWLGSMNGREYSWDWVSEGTISFDVNQPAPMEGCLLYQMVKEYFTTGSVSKKHVYPYLTDYNGENIVDKRGSLVPFEDIDAFVAGVDAGSFIWDIKDPRFLDIKGY